MMENQVKSTLFCGPLELSKSFVFEAAIHWAEEGRHVIYVAPVPLKSLPSKYHDRSNPLPAVFKLIRFMYLSNYEALVEQLVELHTFAALPSVLLIDNLEHYVEDCAIDKLKDIHTARLCAIILDSMNACSRILKTKVYVCASVSSEDKYLYTIYFNDIWCLTSDNCGSAIWLKKITLSSSDTDRRSYKYCKFEDGTIILKQILCAM